MLYNVRKIGFFNNSSILKCLFIFYIIDSVSAPKEEKVGAKTIIYGVQEIVSIAITAPFTTPSDYVLVRKGKISK